MIVFFMTLPVYVLYMWYFFEFMAGPDYLLLGPEHFFGYFGLDL